MADNNQNNNDNNNQINNKHNEDFLRNISYEKINRTFPSPNKKIQLVIDKNNLEMALKDA